MVVHIIKGYIQENSLKKIETKEDFESIKAQGVKRVNVINTILKTGKEKNILDIGCAHEPF